MVMIGFGSKTAEKYIPDMKELILKGIKCQTGREWSEHWAKLKVGSKLQLYWKPRVKPVWKILMNGAIQHKHTLPLESHDYFYRIHDYPKDSVDFWFDGKHAKVLKMNDLSPDSYSFLSTAGTFQYNRKQDILEQQVGGCEFFGKAEVTEIISIEVWKDSYSDKSVKCYSIKRGKWDIEPLEYWPGCKGQPFIKDLAFRDGFRDDIIPDPDLVSVEKFSGAQDDKLTAEAREKTRKDNLTKFTAVEKMFKFFDETYGLETPKRFVFIRWKLC